jgi:hypothetical protein
MADMTSLQLADTDKSVWDLILDKARTLVKSGLLPQEVRTAEACAAIILKGQELRLPAMYSLSNIHVIKGKPTCSAELMLALIYRDHGDMAIRFRETSGQRCVVEYRRKSWPDPSTHTFTMEEAQTAGLTSDNWRKYPGAMLRARCLSAVARMAFPDSIGGMYTPEELGASVRVEGDVVVYDGEFVEAEGRVQNAPATDTPAPEPHDPKPVPARTDPPASPNAIARLHVLAEKIGIDHHGIHDLAVGLCGKASTNELTGRDVHRIEQLLKDPGAAFAELELAREKGGHHTEMIDIEPTDMTAPSNLAERARS